MNNFDTQPLLNEINRLVKNSVQEIVKDFMTRHALLEETQDKLVNLPSVKQYYNTFSDGKMKTVKIEPESEKHETVKEDISGKISSLDDKINNMWKIYGDYFVKMSNQLDDLKNEINALRNEQNSIKPTFIKVEKENITLEILDDAVNECKNIDKLEELMEEEVEDEVEEEVEDEVEEEVEDEVEEEVEEEVASVETETKEIEETEQEEEDDEEELFEIEIDDVTYCTNNEDNGFIYEIDKDGNVGKKVGYLKEGDAYFD